MSKSDNSHKTNNTNKDTASLSNAFPQNKIKSMFASDQRIGRVSSDAADLIGATSTFFLQNLIQSVIAHKESDQKDKSSQIHQESSNDGNDTNDTIKSSKIRKNINDEDLYKEGSSQAITITLDNIRDYITVNNSQYEFLSDTLTDIKDDKLTSKSTNTKRKKESNPNKKRKQVISNAINSKKADNGDGSSITTNLILNAISNNIDAQGSDKHTVDNSFIINDEEEYD